MQANIESLLQRMAAVEATGGASRGESGSQVLIESNGQLRISSGGSLQVNSRTSETESSRRLAERDEFQAELLSLKRQVAALEAAGRRAQASWSVSQ